MALVAFLRGVNVGGHRTFRPTLLARQLEEFEVINIGAAGTFVVCRQVSRSRLRSEMLRRLPFSSEVMICTGRDLIAAASNHPFDGETWRPDIVRFVSVLKTRPQILPLFPLRVPGKGKWLLRIISLHDRFLFGLYRREMRAISYLSTIDKLFGVPTTTRNWNTINAILNTLAKIER